MAKKYVKTTYGSDENLFNDTAVIAIEAVVVILVIILFFWVKKNVTLSANCPKCKIKDYIIRKPRTFLMKNVFFMFRLRKLTCKRCTITFYEAFTDKDIVT